MTNKKRLIDKEKLLDKLTWLAKHEDQFRQSVIGGVMHTIAVTPTVDAVEVVHGRWINPYLNRYGHPCHCCSVCGFKASYQDKNYCPNCGAKMDGGAD